MFDCGSIVLTKISDAMNNISQKVVALEKKIQQWYSNTIKPGYYIWKSSVTTIDNLGIEMHYELESEVDIVALSDNTWAWVIKDVGSDPVNPALLKPTGFLVSPINEKLPGVVRLTGTGGYMGIGTLIDNLLEFRQDFAGFALVQSGTLTPTSK